MNNFNFEYRTKAYNMRKQHMENFTLYFNNSGCYWFMINLCPKDLKREIISYCFNNDIKYITYKEFKEIVNECFDILIVQF